MDERLAGTILQCAVGDKTESLICGKMGGEGGEPDRQQSMLHSCKLSQCTLSGLQDHRSGLTGAM